MLKALLNRKKKPRARKTDWPSDEERAVYMQALVDLSYAKVGVQSSIAGKIGCTRQYVHQVLAAVPLFSQEGYKARAIWETLPIVLAEENFLRAKPIVQAVERGDTVRLTTNDHSLASLVARKLEAFNVAFRQSEEPASKTKVKATIYTFEPA